MEAIQIGGLRLAQDPAVSAGEDLFFLALQLEGAGSYRQDGREARLAPGDFTLCAAARPYAAS